MCRETRLETGVTFQCGEDACQLASNGHIGEAANKWAICIVTFAGRSSVSSMRDSVDCCEKSCNPIELLQLLCILHVDCRVFGEGKRETLTGMDYCLIP